MFETSNAQTCDQPNETQSFKSVTPAASHVQDGIAHALTDSVSSVAMVLQLAPIRLMWPVWFLTGIYMSYQTAQLGELVGTVYYDKTVNAQVFVTWGLASALMAVPRAGAFCTPPAALTCAPKSPISSFSSQ